MKNTITKKRLSCKKVLSKTLIAGALLLGSVPNAVYAQCSQLVWSDEFNGTALDLNKWSYQIGTGTNDGLASGWGNEESQYYTSRPENVKVTGGNLVITAKVEDYLGAKYTSGRVRSRGKGDWLYGSFEAKIKFPEPFQDSKAWPGFWMLPYNNNWPYSGEIDIAETGNEFNEWKYNGTLHYYFGGPQNTGTGGVNIPTTTKPDYDLSRAYHLYRVDWAPNSIKFFVDDIQIGVTQNKSTTVGGAWPFDDGNKFHILFNMAINGWFPGKQVPNTARYPLSMLVDYVRVYSTPSAVQITGNTKVLQGKKGFIYAIPAVPGNSYVWTAPSGASIVKGAGTNQVTVDYGPNAVSGNISVQITPGAGCAVSTSALPISVVAKQCTFVLEDFEGPSSRNLGFNFSTGWMNRANTGASSNPYGTFANPSATGLNTSPLVGKYERNAGSQYDVLAYNDIVIANADGYKKGSVAFNMMVRSDAPLGTEVILQLENRANTAKAWPNGVHSTYTAKTGAVNTWTNLAFTLKDTPDLYQVADSVDQIIVLFNPNSYTGNTFYFDNFKSVGTTPATSAITGTATVCSKSTGIKYSVTGLDGSSFNWSVPAGASIISGQGTNSIFVDFGTATGGNISVTESSIVNCNGALKTFPVTINAGCVIAAEFTTNKTSTCEGSKVVFTDKTLGTNGSQTYLWNFGAGANPATANTAGPVKVTYTGSGTKTVTLTVTQGGTSNTKTSYITVTDPEIGCLFNNDFTDAGVKFTSANNAFSHTKDGNAWNVANAGHGEWESWTYTLNDNVKAKAIDFTCTNNKPVLKIRVKASANCLLRIEMLDSNGVATDFVPTYNMELTTAYQTFTINYSGFLYNKYGCTNGCGPLDSSIVKTLRFFVNPGYTSYPYAGKNKTYNTAFTNGTINIDWIGIGDNCSQVPPVADFNASIAAACTSQTVTFTSASTSTDAGTKYSWNFGDGATPATAITAGPHNVKYATAGSKTAVLTLNGGVSTKTKSNYITVTNCVTGIENLSALERIITYPNPANSELNIKINADSGVDGVFVLTNSLSQEVIHFSKRVDAGENRITVPLNNLENGLYFLHIQTGNQSVVKRISIVR